MTTVTGIDLPQERRRFVKQIERQGVRYTAAHDSMRALPREAFALPLLHEFACQIAPSPPIGNEQTISQPFIVALMATALELKADDRELEIGTGWGNALATEMGVRGETNVGPLCRREFRDDAYVIGQATDHGTVAAAAQWDAEMQVMQVHPARQESCGRLCHDSGVWRFLLPLRQPPQLQLREKLNAPWMQRAIGVVYRSQLEVQSQYFHASLPAQFDELIWFGESRAV